MTVYYVKSTMGFFVQSHCCHFFALDPLTYRDLVPRLFPYRLAITGVLSTSGFSHLRLAA